MSHVATTTSQGDEMGLYTVSAARTGLEIVSEYCPERPYLELQVPPNIEAVRKAVFKTISRDQGYSNEPEEHGSYRNSHSWFELAVVTSSYHIRGHRQHLQSNIHAKPIFHEHVNSWDWEEEKNSSRRQWFDNIRPGDHIQIIPKAHHKGWRNYIMSAEIIVSGRRRHTDLNLVTPKPPLPDPDRKYNTTQRNCLYDPPLSKEGQIRLVRLHGGRLSEELSCSMEYADLDNSSYQALSYCWGSWDKAEEITVCDSRTLATIKLKITGNLAKCLRQLRPNEESESRTLWIDALCINQLNLQELADQVLIMSDIYSKAEVVVVWLGKPEGIFEKNIDFAKTVLSEDREPLSLRQTLDLIRTLNRVDDREGDRESFLSDNRTDSKILEFDYFRRVWVLQECFNARKIDVVCGRLKIPWAWLLRINDCLNWVQLVSANPGSNVVMPTLFARLFEYKIDPNISDKDCLQHSRIPQTMPILEVLIGGLDLDATDPRDKIFALLPFSNFSGPNLPDDVKPDYTKSVGQVFADFTRWWILHHSSLQILSAVHASVGRTWQKLSPREAKFPRGNKNERASWSIWHDGKTNWAQACLAVRESSISPLMQASEGTSVDLDLARRGSGAMALSLAGRLIGKIAAIGPFPFFDTAEHVQISHVDSQNHQGDCELKKLYDIYNHVFDPLSFTQTWKGNVQPHQMVQDHLNSHLTPHETRARLMDHSSTHTPWMQNSAGAVRPARSDFPCHSHCTFTLEGEGSGLCPAVAQTGDTVVVLYGGSVPYILREVGRDAGSESGREETAPGKEYWLIGECYLPIIMQGQAVRQENAERYPETVFTLV